MEKKRTLIDNIIIKGAPFFLNIHTSCYKSSLVERRIDVFHGLSDEYLNERYETQVLVYVFEKSESDEQHAMPGGIGI